MRIVVCAALPGRALQVDRAAAKGSKGLLDVGGHWHVSPGELEYIVFEPAQIIPCYVLHLDFGAAYPKETFDRLIANPTTFFKKRQGAKAKNKWVEPEDCPGDVQRKKENLKAAAAAKWFPYGYGPASGTSFVIEDIAEVSNDEEVYGDFQDQRIEENEVNEKMIEGRSWFDEYQTVWRTKGDVRVPDQIEE